MSIYKKEALQEEMQQEALLRMELLGLDVQAIRRFQEEGAVSLSQQAGQKFLIQPLDSRLSEQVRRFEAEYECLVYHAIASMNPIVGCCWSLLFVSPASSDWRSERSYIKSSGIVYAYSHSELEEGVGEILVEPWNGALARIG